MQISSLLRNTSPSFYTAPQLSAYEIVKPVSGNVEDVILSGSLENHRSGIPLAVSITFPDEKIQNFAALISSSGHYKSVISVNENSMAGIYEIELSHDDEYVKTISFIVSDPVIPQWIKNNAKWWANDQISDEDFVKSIQYLVKKGIIRI